MSLEFYSNIIEIEKKKFGITNEELKIAARAISSSYSKNSLETGSTYLDYNKPECRCAYLYKYANLHTGMVTKYFRKFVRKSEIRNHLRKSIKICSLGGGPGTDVIGISKALAVIPYFHQRINQVSVLDICGGWSNTFENIISGLLTGKVRDVPDTFINSNKFKHELVEVDLLQSLPKNVMGIISKADIICMVKFISVILAKEGCLHALKVIGNLFKPGATVLFIDNFQGNIFESVKDILNENGLEIVLGPSNETFVKPAKQHNKATYGCLAQTAARIFIVGFIKREIKIMPQIFYTPIDESYNNCNKQEDLIITSVGLDKDIDENADSGLNNYCHKYVQTEFEESTNFGEDHMQAESLDYEVEELSALMKALADLLKVFDNVKKNNRRPKDLCCHCHSKHCF